MSHLTTWGRKFNAWLGSNRTYIANDSSGLIVATVTGTRFNISSVHITKGKENVSGGFTIDRTATSGWVMISKRETHEFLRNGDPDYLTVAVQDGDEFRVIVHNFELAANISYIVSDTRIARQKYGSSNLFERA